MNFGKQKTDLKEMMKNPLSVQKQRAMGDQVSGVLKPTSHTSGYEKKAKAKK